MNKYIVKNINNIAGREIVEVTACKAEKLSALYSVINGKRCSYNVVGLVDRTNDVVLEPTYYNVRNAKGQFAGIRQRRRSASSK